MCCIPRLASAPRTPGRWRRLLATVGLLGGALVWYGLGALAGPRRTRRWWSAITLKAGAVVESNFHDFPMQRLADAPEVVVEIVPSELPPGGAGEPGIVTVAAAIANAIHAATGGACGRRRSQSPTPSASAPHAQRPARPSGRPRAGPP
jgi:hypothetical protein